MVDPFCITEPGFFIFNLAVNYSSEMNRVPNIETMLLIDEVPVAVSKVDDNQEPSNAALFYEAMLNGTETVKVSAMSGNRSYFVKAQ